MQEKEALFEMLQKAAIQGLKPALSDKGTEFYFLLTKRCQETCDLKPVKGK